MDGFEGIGARRILLHAFCNPRVAHPPALVRGAGSVALTVFREDYRIWKAPSVRAASA
jgi:hypothetical protein